MGDEEGAGGATAVGACDKEVPEHRLELLARLQKMAEEKGGAGGKDRCQVLNCKEKLEAGAPGYYRRFKICPHHASLPELVMVCGRRVRFCQLCGRFEEIANFDGKKKSCRTSLEKHNRRRRARRARKADAHLSATPATSHGHTGDDSSGTALDNSVPTGAMSISGAWTPPPFMLPIPQQQPQQRSPASGAAVPDGVPSHQLPFPQRGCPGQPSQLPPPLQLPQQQQHSLDPSRAVQETSRHVAHCFLRQSNPVGGIGEGFLPSHTGPGQGRVSADGASLLPAPAVHSMPALQPRHLLQLQKLLHLKRMLPKWQQQREAASRPVVGLAGGQALGGAPAPFPPLMQPSSMSGGLHCEWAQEELEEALLPMEAEVGLPPSMSLAPTPPPTSREPAGLPWQPDAAAAAEAAAWVPVPKGSSNNNDERCEQRPEPVQPPAQMAPALCALSVGEFAASVGGSAGPVPGPAPAGMPAAGATEQSGRAGSSRTRLPWHLLPALQEQQRAFEGDLARVSFDLFGVAPDLLAPHVRDSVVKLMAADPGLAAMANSTATILAPALP